MVPAQIDVEEEMGSRGRLALSMRAKVSVAGLCFLVAMGVVFYSNVPNGVKAVRGLAQGQPPVENEDSEAAWRVQVFRRESELIVWANGGPLVDLWPTHYDEMTGRIILFQVSSTTSSWTDHGEFEPDVPWMVAGNWMFRGFPLEQGRPSTVIVEIKPYAFEERVGNLDGVAALNQALLLLLLPSLFLPVLTLSGSLARRSRFVASLARRGPTKILLSALFTFVLSGFLLGAAPLLVSYLAPNCSLIPLMISGETNIVDGLWWFLALPLPPYLFVMNFCVLQSIQLCLVYLEIFTGSFTRLCGRLLGSPVRGLCGWLLESHRAVFLESGPVKSRRLVLLGHVIVSGVLLLVGIRFLETDQRLVGILLSWIGLVDVMVVALLAVLKRWLAFRG